MRINLLLLLLPESKSKIKMKFIIVIILYFNISSCFFIYHKDDNFTIEEKKFLNETIFHRENFIELYLNLAKLDLYVNVKSCDIINFTSLISKSTIENNINFPILYLKDYLFDTKNLIAHMIDIVAQYWLYDDQNLSKLTIVENIIETNHNKEEGIELDLLFKKKNIFLLFDCFDETIVNNETILASTSQIKISFNKNRKINNIFEFFLITLHEFGHFLGFDHSLDDKESTMTERFQITNRIFSKYDKIKIKKYKDILDKYYKNKIITVDQIEEELLELLLN